MAFREGVQRIDQFSCELSFVPPVPQARRAATKDEHAVLRQSAATAIAEMRCDFAYRSIRIAQKKAGAANPGERQDFSANPSVRG